jgi:hypothetical protein
MYFPASLSWVCGQSRETVDSLANAKKVAESFMNAPVNVAEVQQDKNTSRRIQDFQD